MPTRRQRYRARSFVLGRQTCQTSKYAAKPRNRSTDRTYSLAEKQTEIGKSAKPPRGRIRTNLSILLRSSGRSPRAFIDPFSFPPLEQRQGSRIGLRDSRPERSSRPELVVNNVILHPREIRRDAALGGSPRAARESRRFRLERAFSSLAESAKTSASSWRCILLSARGLSGKEFGLLLGDLEANSLARVLFGLKRKPAQTTALSLSRR